MTKFSKAIRYGINSKEMQLSQRAAHLANKSRTKCVRELFDYVHMDKNIRRSKKDIRHYKECPSLSRIGEHEVYTFSSDSLMFEPHSDDGNFVEHCSKLLGDIGKYANLDMTDELVAEVEGVLALIVTLQGCVDYVSMSSAIFLYARKFLSKSVTKQVMNYLKELFEYETQSGTEDVVQSGDWLDLVRNARENWTLVKDNKLFSHFSKLLGLIVTLGLFKASDLTFDIKEFRVWEPDMKVIHGNAWDIIDAALQTVSFFVERISLCYREKSLKPLLVNDKAAAELDEEFANIILWWELVKNGNLKKVANMCESEFDRRLETLCTKVRNMSSSKSPFERKLIQDKFIRLLRIKNDYITMKISSGIRRAPFCIELFGGSSQGKTTCAEQIVEALLISAGLPTGKEYQASYNAADKFMSNWTTDKLVLFIDDMANDKSQFVERPPTRVIIDVCNNQPFYANMADLDSKGKVFVEPSIVVVTTNLKDLDARIYSNCPYSIQRRMQAVLTIQAKRKFQFIVDGKPQGIDSAKVRKYYERLGTNPTFDDLWEITIEKAVEPPCLKAQAPYKPVKYRGRTMCKVSFREVVQYLIDQYHDHLLAQESILERMKKRQKEIKLCGVDGCKHIAGYCDIHDNKPHFGEEIASSMQSAGSIISGRIKRDIFGLDRMIEGGCVYAIMKSARYFARHWDWLNIIPSHWLANQYFCNILLLLHGNQIKRNYILYTCLLWFGIVGLMFYLNSRTLDLFDQSTFHLLGASILYIGFVIQKSMVSLVTREYRRQLVDRNTIAPIMQEFRDRHVDRICKACTIIGALYGIAQVYKSWRKLQAQGSLEPKTLAEVNQRDSEENIWTSVTVRPLPILPDATNTSPEQLKGLVSKNLVYGTVVVGDKTMMVNGLFMRSNVVLIPNHYFEKEVLDVTFRKENPDATGGKFCVRLSLKQSFRVPGTDLRYCYSSNGGSFKNLTKYLSNEELPQHEFEMLWRSKQGVLTVANGLAQPGDTSNGVCDFRGYIYDTLTIDTFRGMCGATLMSKRKAIITSIHLGGKTGTPRGCSGILKRYDFERACDELRKLEGVILSGTAEKFEAQVLGVNILTNQGLHPKSPLNYLPSNSQVEYYGSCRGMATFVSDVKPTLISEYVTDIMGYPNKFGPPVQTPQYYGWQNCLSALANPAKPYDPALLEVAIRDYKSDLIPIFQSPLWNGAKPLNDHENLCGIPGKKFMDAIKLNTSIGYPLSGQKRNYVTELEPTPEMPNNKVLDSEIMSEIQRCEDCYKRGERAYTIAKACKKDEVLSKPKCRIFYGNPIALTWLVRKYYLPILRVIQMNPIVSECAVGVNSHGPEWDQLHKQIYKFGEDRLIGGDYGQYDQRIPSQLLFASLRIMIDFARECYYSEEDLRIMEAMTGDIVFAVIAFNGDLIGLTEGTHISGNPLTAITNGICGSLNQRCFFYKQHFPKTFEERLPFREYVSLVTYGDDNIGSVSPVITDFTIKGVSEFLGEYGQIYTMPDKESELVDFLPKEDFEFLKRKSVYHDELGVYIGALIDKSCFKMLHCYLRGKNAPLTEEHACGQNIDTAMREWFNHGREVYDQRREQLVSVARAANILHLCTELDVTYDDRVRNWKDKYVHEPSENPIDLDTS